MCCAQVKDKDGRAALTITDDGTRAIFKRYLYFCGRYEIDFIQAPIHVSDTSIVFSGRDHNVAQIYSAQFDIGLVMQTKDTGLEVDQLQASGGFVHCAMALGLHSNVSAVERTRAILGDLRCLIKGNRDSVTREEFIYGWD